MLSPQRDTAAPPSLQPIVLIVSADAVEAALLGALIELLGYEVRFARPPESVHEALRRVRPRIYLCDADDAELYSDDIVGRAVMRGVSVVIFGEQEVLDRVRDFARAHRIETLLVPPERGELERVLQRALAH